MIEKITFETNGLKVVFQTYPNHRFTRAGLHEIGEFLTHYADLTYQPIKTMKKEAAARRDKEVKK